MPNGDLVEFITKHPGADRLRLVGVSAVGFDPCLPPHQLSDAAAGLDFLHSRNVIHGDLKGVRDCLKLNLMSVLTRVKSNILVDATVRARIADFGHAVDSQNLDSVRCILGELGRASQWTAPEILSEEGTFSKEADVFSFAMVMIEVRCECVIPVEPQFIVIPYHHRDLPALFHSIIVYLKRLWRQ